MDDKIFGLPPLLPKCPKVLILGSMPSVKSLEQSEYYGNPRNHFWPIMFELFQTKPLEAYEEKTAWLKRKEIALWDTIGSCIREGSLDSAIKEEEPNDILQLLKAYPSIRLIACNGTKSYDTFKKHILLTNLGDVEIIKLPSSSPIPGRYTKTFDGKVAVWRVILKYLVNE